MEAKGTPGWLLEIREYWCRLGGDRDGRLSAGTGDLPPVLEATKTESLAPPAEARSAIVTPAPFAGRPDAAR